MSSTSVCEEKYNSADGGVDVVVDPQVDKYEVLKAAAAEKFKEKKFEEALTIYNEASTVIYSDGDSNPINVNGFVVCKNNAAQCCINLRKFRGAVTYATEALSKDPRNIKALYRRGISHLALNEGLDAFLNLKSGLELEPGNISIQEELRKAESMCVISLLEASDRGDGFVVDSLIKAGLSVESKTEATKASFEGDKITLSSGMFHYGETALHKASFNGHEVVVDSLIRAGANLDAQNSDGNYALLTAASNGHKSILESLIRAGASLDLRNKYGFTALIVVDG